LSLLDCLFGHYGLPIQHKSAQRRNYQKRRTGGDNPSYPGLRLNRRDARFLGKARLFNYWPRGLRSSFRVQQCRSHGGGIRITFFRILRERLHQHVHHRLWDRHAKLRQRRRLLLGLRAD